MSSSADSEGIGSRAGLETRSINFVLEGDKLNSKIRAAAFDFQCESHSIRCHQMVNTTATCGKVEVLWVTDLNVLDGLIDY